MSSPHEALPGPDIARPEGFADELLKQLNHAVRGRLSRLHVQIEMAGLEAQREARLLDEIRAIEHLFISHRELLRAPPRGAAHWVTLTDVLQEVLRQVRPQAPLHCSESLQLPLLTWPELLVPALRELLRNALTHGTAPIRIHAVADGAAVELVCADSGAGFDPESLPQLSKPFAHVAGGAHNGSGIGLSVVQRMASLLRGQLFARRSATGFEVGLRLQPPAVSTELPQRAT